MTLERVPEPELMDEAMQARAYADADFEQPNGQFVERFEQYIGVPGGPVLDIGCGPGDIPLRLARRFPELEVHGLDGARAMLALAREALTQEPALAPRVRFFAGRIPGASLPHAGRYGAVISNSVLHHLHHPDALWRTVRQAAAPGAGVLIMDLFRPADRDTAVAIVDTYAANEPEILRRDFFNSLLAAFAPDEVTVQLQRASLAHLRVETVSDRHLLVHGTA